jgi:hypothetical protein
MRFQVHTEYSERSGNCLHHQSDESLNTLVMGAVHTSETSVYFYETIWRYTAEDCHLHGKYELSNYFNWIRGICTHISINFE